MKNIWYHVAENSLRNETKNFDLTLLQTGGLSDNCFIEASGGGEHYVIFRGRKSFESYKGYYIDTFAYIDTTQPIKLTGQHIAFKIQFDNV